MTLRLGGDGAITGCTSLENPDLTVSGLTISGSFDAEKVLVASGTAAAPSYTFSGDTDNGLYYAGTNSIGLSTAGTNAIVVDASQQVGIGTTTVDAKLHITESNTNPASTTSTDVNRILLEDNSGSTATGAGYSIDFEGVYGGLGRLAISKATSGTSGTSRDNGKFSLFLNQNLSEDSYSAFQEAITIDSSGTDQGLIYRFRGSEQLRIDNSGRLLVGTSSSLTDGSTIQAIGRHAIDALRYSAPTGNAGPKIQLTRSASDTVGTTAAVSATDDLGEINFAGATSSSTFNQGAQIRATVESGTISSTSLPTKLTFHTTADGASSATERMHIDSSGNIGVGGAPTVFTGQNFISIHSPGSSTNIAGLDFYASGTRESGFLSYPSNGENLRIFGNTARAITVHNNGSERMRIDSSGNVGIGKSSPDTTLHIDSKGATTTLKITSDTESSIDFEDHGGSPQRYKIGTNITTNSGQLEFKDITANIERFRINNDGSTSQFTSHSNVHISRSGNSAGTTNSIYTGVRSATNNTNGTVVYRVYTNGTYATISDINQKKNIETTRDGYLDDLNQLRVVKYNWNEQKDSDPKELGLIAQEVEQIFPGLVSLITDDNDQEQYKGIKTSVLPYMLLKALQEATERIKILETKVVALENN